MEVVGGVASVIAIIQLTGQIAKICKGYISDVKDAESDQDAIITQVENIGELLEEVDSLIKGPHKEKFIASENLQGTLTKCRKFLLDLEKNLKPTARSRFMKHLKALKWPMKKSEVERLMGNLKGLEDSIRFAIQLDQAKLVVGIDEKINLISLPVVEGAIFGSFADQHEPKCLPETRKQLLVDVDSWALGPRDKTIFWLSGAAGTGKSTISRTVATNFHGRGMLGGSFFFKRGGGDRANASKFFTTLATGLILHIPHLRPLVSRVIEKDPDIPRKSLKEQFEKLILEPLSSIPPSGLRRAVLVVIDALDECEEDRDINLIVRLLGRTRAVKEVDMRIFITSRPETPVRAGFKKIAGSYENLILQDIEESVIKSDISAFLRHEFSNIQEENDGTLPLGWPGDDTIQIITDMATPLFIVAATICRLIADPNFSPERQLQNIFKYQKRRKISKLSQTYLPIFDPLLVNRDEEEKRRILTEFREIVGTIVILESPLSRLSLSQLLGVDEDIIQRRLSAFHSVLHIPESNSEAIRTFHLSFREFLLDPQTKGETPFALEEKALHRYFARSCIAYMSRTLRKNICGLLSPGTLRENIPASVIRDKIPLSLSYACQYWIYHFVQGYEGDEGDDVVLRQFLLSYLLNWLEATSLIGIFLQNIYAIIDLESVLLEHKRQSSAELVYDIKRFIQSYQSIANDIPLQIYSSALLFSPKNSLVRKQFQGTHLGWVRLQPVVEDGWGSILHSLSFSVAPLSIALSRDNKMVAVGFEGRHMIGIFDTTSGEMLQTLYDEDMAPYSLKFSPSGNVIASRSIFSKNRVILWDLPSETVIQKLKGSLYYVSEMVFSPDGQLFALGCYPARPEESSSIDIYTTAMWTLVQSIKWTGPRVYDIDISADNALLLFMGELRIGTTLNLVIWELHSRNQVLTKKSSWGTNVKFLESGETVVVSSNASGVAFYQLESNRLELRKTWNFPSSFNYSSQFLGNDLILLLARSGGGDCEIWDIASESLAMRLSASNRKPNSVAVSPAKALLAEINGKDLNIWDLASTRAYSVDKSDKRFLDVLFRARSVSGDLLASALCWRKKTVGLWKLTPQGLELYQLFNQDKFSYENGAFSADGKLLAVFGGREMFVLKVETRDVMLRKSLKKDPMGFFACVAFSPDSSLLSTGDTNGSIAIFNLVTRQEYSLKGAEFEVLVQCLQFSPDGKLLAAGYDFKAGSSLIDSSYIELYDTSTRLLKRSIEFPFLSFETKFRFSGDGRELIIETGTRIDYMDLSSFEFRSSILADEAVWRLDESASWVMQGGEKILRIPSEYSPTRLKPGESYRGHNYNYDIAGNDIIWHHGKRLNRMILDPYDPTERE
ncbi:hypothetical protein ABW19_dt0201999 [Dactylella cylindrospora]|nr:hypothetical protein ABW19_dt0201999 [Dactylella cylindrospora]